MAKRKKKHHQKVSQTTIKQFREIKKLKLACHKLPQLSTVN